MGGPPNKQGLSFRVCSGIFARGDEMSENFLFLSFCLHSRLNYFGKENFCSQSDVSIDYVDKDVKSTAMRVMQAGSHLRLG